MFDGFVAVVPHGSSILVGFGTMGGLWAASELYTASPREPLIQGCGCTPRRLCIFLRNDSMDRNYWKLYPSLSFSLFFFLFFRAETFIQLKPIIEREKNLVVQLRLIERKII